MNICDNFYIDCICASAIICLVCELVTIFHCVLEHKISERCIVLCLNGSCVVLSIIYVSPSIPEINKAKLNKAFAKVNNFP